MIKLINLLLENSTSKYKYGCVMLYFNFPQLSEIQSQIDQEDIYIEEGEKTYGLEDEPHCTLLYGLHEEVSLDQIKKISDLYGWGPKPLIANNISCFNNEKYDVLKFDMNGDILYEFNQDLIELPHTTDFPDYHPHLTIGYLKSGMGEKYIKMFKGLEFPLKANHVVYSQPNGNKDKIEINKNYE